MADYCRKHINQVSLLPKYDTKCVPNLSYEKCNVRRYLPENKKVVEVGRFLYG
jgi:hypothetical protein